MSAEPYLASLVSNIVVSDSPIIPQGYFRSKLFLTSSTTNPLVAAASPLLSLLERLCLSPTLPKIDDIRDNIQHELYAFHSRLEGQQYAGEFVIIANYLLSATIDELLGKNYLRLNNEPAEFKSFTPASLDNVEPQSRFFEIIHIIKQRINQLIREHRVNKPSRLLKEEAKPDHEPTNHKPIVTAGFLALSLLAFSFLGSHTLLEHKAQTLLLGHIPQLG